MGFDVGQLPYFFEYFVIEPLGFVDDDQNPFFIGIGFVQEMNKVNKEIAFASELFVDIESVQQKVIEIQFFQPRVRDGGNKDILIQTFQQPIDEGRLSRTHITHQ